MVRLAGLHAARSSARRPESSAQQSGRSSLASLVGNRAFGRLLHGRDPREPIRDALAREGEPLDPAVQAAMEQELGRELGDVRVHRDGQAERAAEAANATAFTVGNHVVFGRDAYDPQSAQGRRVLAHELTHVLQRSRPGSLGVAPPAAAAEQQARSGTPGGAAATSGIARIGEKDLTKLDAAGLDREYDMVLQWLADNPTGADRAATLSYLDEIEQAMLDRASASTPALPSPFANVGDEALAEFARQGDTDAASELFSRASSGPGFEPPDPGSELWRPEETYPDFIGPERPPYRSGFTPLQPGDIDRYGSFNTAARTGDELAGHEVLQNAWLKATGQSQRRGIGPVSRGNPSLAVDDALHARIDAAQRSRGLWNSQQLATMTDEEVIDANVAALEEAGVERSQIVIMRREASRYAAELRARAAAPPPPTAPPAAAPSPPAAAPSEATGAIDVGAAESGAADVAAADVAAADIAVADVAATTASEFGLGEIAATLGVGLVEGLAFGLALELGINVAKHMFGGKGSKDPEQERIEALLKEKVGLPAARAVLAQKKRAQQLTAQNAEDSLYAIVTVDLVYTEDEQIQGAPVVGMSVHRDPPRLTDASLVSVAIGFDPVTTPELTIGIDESIGHYRKQTRRKIYSTELNALKETTEIHHWRALRQFAQQAVARGVSVRTIAEGTHWVNALPGHEPGRASYVSRDWTWDDERRQKQPRGPHDPSWREQVERQEQELWVQAYIDYTGDHPELRAQYDEAMQYLKELQAQDAARAREQAGPFTFTGPAVLPKDRKVLEEFLRAQER